MILVDSNIYLRLFQVCAGKKLLNALRERAAEVFVTRQIVREVMRNKLRIAEDLFKKLKIEVTMPDMPEHLFGIDDAVSCTLRSKLNGAKKAAADAQAATKTEISRCLDKISKSEDEVSLVLNEIFSNPVDETPEELAAAERRRLLGDPPGKSGQALGDQLTWEQFLNASRNCEKLWIITKDGDYFVKSNDCVRLNPLLYCDLRCANQRLTREVHCFDDPVKGLEHYLRAKGVQTSLQMSESERSAYNHEWLTTIAPTTTTPPPPPVSWMYTPNHAYIAQPVYVPEDNRNRDCNMDTQ